MNLLLLPLSFIPKSDALVEINRIRDHNFSYFDFQIGDIVRLPDGKPISVGKRPEEGLLERGLVEGAFAMSETGNVPVYSAPPSVLVKMLPNRTNGTAIIINGVTNRLFDAETISDIELGDRSGEKGYLFSLKDYGCLVNGIYDVNIDVPNDRTNRHWKFALINGLNFEFEDSAYIFAPKGTIRYDSALKVKSEDAFLENDKEKNTFNFLIDAEHDTLHFSVDNLRLMIDVPMFAYKFDDGPWETQHPSDIWYTDFPKKIYIRYLAEKLKLIVDEKNNEEEARREITYEKLKSGLFECDVTWLRSWFSRNEAKKKVYVELSGSKQHFVDVVTKSIIVSSIIKGDFKKGTLIGSFDIIGKSNYFADISYNGSILANKIPIINGQLEFPADLLSGKYEVAVFEEELDNGGFNTTYYYPLQTFIRDLINPADLRGKNIRIRYIKNGIDSIFKIPLRHSYKVVNLRRHDKQDRHNYIGDLIDDTLKKVLLKVNVYIPDLNQLQYSSITFFDEYGDLVELLYDHKTGEIVSEEQNGLRPSEKYRRYECLFSDEYFFGFDFV